MLTQLEELRQYLSENVADIEFMEDQDNNKCSEGLEIRLDDWNRISSLHFSSFGPKFCKSIASSMTSLTSLHLNNCSIDGQTALLIAESFVRLTYLDLSGNTIRQFGGLAIAKHLTSLLKLNLQDNKVGDFAVAAIARRLKSLAYLNLTNNKVGNCGAQKIAANCRQVRQLYLGWNNITEGGALKLANMRQLVALDVKTNLIGMFGAVAIARGLPDVKFLRIGNNKIGDFGVKLVCNSCRKINRLGLWDSALTSDSASQIGKLTNLSWLSLAHNNLTQPDIVNLCYSLKHLKHLDVSKIDISEQGRTNMKTILPNCDIQFSFNY